MSMLEMHVASRASTVKLYRVLTYFKWIDWTLKSVFAIPFQV